MSDTLHKYLALDHGTRVQAVRLEDAWRTGLAHQDLPPVLRGLLGELAAAAVLLASNIKFNGSIVLQLQGNGPARLIVVECTADLGLRATAHVREGADIPADGTLQTLLNADGQGRFMVMLDPAERAAGTPAYQGIVPLEGETVAEALEHYMRNSEQLDTRMWLAADERHCAGFLLQRMPETGGQAAEPGAEPSWERFVALAETLQAAELLAEDTETLIHRLFWQDDLRMFEPRSVRWHCPCSRERVANMLRSLGRAEIDSILREQEQVQIACNFCGKPYAFDAVDCAMLFTDSPQIPQEPGRTLH
ncbi:Hsp33 family molecular chaperone HslO [Castellaniella sp. GW247-6E4]|uniref:Hsp33 family molecular chaperone HslO n=1 Tax=Castellaniella sp. GW247-6E4 TaxID=3140380 RepID=UPI0033146BAB